MSLFLLSNEILKQEKISFLPRMKGLFSLLENAQVIFMGLLVILTVILAIYAVIPLPSIPQKFILCKAERSISKSLATDLGIILQSAPVSTKKSNFWYPYLVKTEMGIIGSGIIPNWVRFWFSGNSKRIDANCSFRRDEANYQCSSINMFAKKLFYEPRVGAGKCKNSIIFSSDIFTAIAFLEFGIRNSFHINSPFKSNIA
jgi:hypothetical protein